MSFAEDLTSFIEERLKAYDSTIDLSAGSPAEIQIVQPIVAKLGEDPFSTDISSFLRDRLVQEFPEMAADDGGLLEDIFTKPLQLMLEPFKREVLKVRNNQSVANLELLSEDEADALGANWFATRNIGNVVTGPVRVYFAAPNTVRITTDKVLTTASGLNFFPAQTYYISSAQMAFNRDGSLYFIDIIVVAEQSGDQYNVKKGDISDLQDVPGVLKVANLYDMAGGVPKQTNTEFINYLEQSLIERSLVTKRGVITRVTQLFDSVRALQVLGAGEPGMDRDILKGTGEGSLHLVANECLLYSTWLWVSGVVFKDDGVSNDVVVQAGDTIKFQNTKLVDTELTVYTAIIEQVIPATTGDEGYLLILDRALAPHSPEGRVAVFKPGFITVSEVPGGMAADVTVPEGMIHLGGHVDVFARPTSDVELQTSIQNVTDDDPLVASTEFIVTPANKNIVKTYGDVIDFLSRGVQIGDVLSLETGTNFAGTYHILAVAQYELRVDALFTAATGSFERLRGRIVRIQHVSLNEPRQLKLPFGTQAANNLATVVGSTLFKFEGLSIQDYGAIKGDIIRVLDGPDAGDFIIDSFDPLGAYVTVAATSTGSNLRYEIFSKYTGITFPLVRIKGFEVLDSSGQGTGITVPYGDVVDSRPVIGMEGAGDIFEVYDKNIMVWPSCFQDYSPDDPSSVGEGHDPRYTQKIATADGVIRKVAFDATNSIHEVEVNFPPFVYNTKRDTLLVLPNEPDIKFTEASPGYHRTSPVAEAKVGDSISILDGPNQGKYLIRDLRVLDLWGANSATKGHQKVALVQIDPELPSDPIASAIAMIHDLGGTEVTVTDLVTSLHWVSDWYNASGFWYGTLIPRLKAVLLAHGITMTDAQVSELVGAQCYSSYKVGPSAHGMLRLYFLEPVSTELYYGDDPTLFDVILDTEKRYRLDPNMDPAQIFPEAASETPATEWNRDSLMPLNFGAYLALSSGSAFPKRGIRAGDLLEYRPALDCMLARGGMKTSFLCCTQAGSNIVQLLLPNTDEEGSILARGIFEPGQLFFIDSGPDLGAYTIVEVLNQLTTPTPPTLPIVRVRLDRVLSHSTLAFPTGARFAPLTAVEGTARVYDLTTGEDLLTGVKAGKWITLYAVSDEDFGTNDDFWDYGDDAAYLGSFEILTDATADPDAGPYLDKVFVKLDKSSFPDGTSTLPNGNKKVFFLVHDAPDDAPLDTDRGGKDISPQFVRWRAYGQLSVQSLLDIDWSSDPCPIVEATAHEFVQQLSLGDPLSADHYSHKVPYRIVRPWVYRQSSTAISKNREGALYYMDIPVVGLGPGSEMNISEDSALRLAGRYSLAGYSLEVENPSLTYSTKEKLSVILPVSVLPVGSTPDLDNEIRLAGQTLRISYNEAPLIEEMQALFDSPQDRVLVANSLVRHFLPGYVFLDVNYAGGSQVETVAADLITLIDNISPDYNQLTSDAIVTAVKMRGAMTVTLPITLLALVHGIDRRIRGVRSKDAIGAGTEPTFAGNFTQTYFISGPDTSKLDPRPIGEQVYLTRG